MITVELVKLLRRPRTWISVVLTCALPFMVAVFITITHLVPPPGQGSAFLSAVLQDGALYPAAALALVLPVFLPVAVAVVAGDSIAGEATGGRCATCWSARSAGPGCWSPSSSRSSCTCCWWCWR